MAVSGALAYCGWGQKVSEGGTVKVVQVIVVALWTILPPMFFWIEYIWLYKRTFDITDKDRFEAFKYQQDLSSKIWIALVSVLLMLYFWKDIART